VSIDAHLSESDVTSVFDSGLVIVAGKGGVGKTTVSAVLARAAANHGLRVLLVELDGKPTLGALVPDLAVRQISAAAALEEYLHEHGFRMIAKRLASTGVIDVVGTAAPGIDDLVVLGKLKQLERSGEWDVIIVDGPAAGHAVTFLTSAAGLHDAVRSGPVRAQADEVLALLGDHERCQVVLVTLPETTPVNELLETAEVLTSRVGVRLGPVVINQVDEAAPLPDPQAVSFGRRRTHVADAMAAADFRRARQAAQAVELGRLSESVAQPTIVLTALQTAALDPAAIDELLDRRRR
jgi:arsenite/tail-anchored protein-transporting ATPase